jgi:NADP-dependent alcohol dehydrogenase
LDFFERMGIKTRLRDYVADARIDALLAKLEEHGMTALGEHGDIDLAQSRHIYEAAW